MAKFLAAALAFAGALLLTPVASAQTISAPLRVATGDAFTVNVAYTQSSEIADEPIEVTMHYLYAVHVLDAEQRLWRFTPISISYDIPDMPGFDSEEARNINWPAMSEMMSALMRIGTDVGFECRVDEYGRCMDMTNWPFWSARIENLVLAFDSAARMMPTRAQSAEELPTIVPTPPMVVPPAPAPRRTKNIESAVSEEAGMVEVEAAEPPFDWERARGPVLQGIARMIDGVDSRDAASSMSGVYLPAFVQGRTLTRRETVNFVDEYEMPFGAPALRFNASLTLDRIDRRTNTATVVRRASLDEASVRAALSSMTSFASDAFLTPLAAEFGEEGQNMPSGEALGDMLNSMLNGLTYEETTRGVIDLSTGMARETTTEFTASVRVVAEEEPMQMRGRIVTRVTPGAPAAPRLPRG
jgi:hypothetical protein